MNSDATKVAFQKFVELVVFNKKTIQNRHKLSSSRIYDLLTVTSEASKTQFLQNSSGDIKITKECYPEYVFRGDDSSESHEYITNPTTYYTTIKSSSDENEVNNERLEGFKRDLTLELLDALKDESVEPGVMGKADEIITKCLAANKFATATWLNDLFIKNFHQPSVAADLLMLAGRLPYEIANPSAVTMAVAGFSHSNVAVQEAAIRAFENWANKESLNVLLNVTVHPKWLKDYLAEVINDLRGMCETVS